MRKQASVGRGKAELFPLQGVRVRLNLQGRFFNYRVFYSLDLEENHLNKIEFFTKSHSYTVIFKIKK